MRVSRLKAFRERCAHRKVHLVGHIADTPQIIAWKDRRYMVFHLRELPGTVLHVNMLPITVTRHKGDRVEITCRLSDDATAFVESVQAQTDLEIVRQAEWGRSRTHR